MKRKIIFISIISIALVLNMQAEIICYVKYKYDESGNRIHRYYECKDVIVVDGEILDDTPPPTARQNNKQDGKKEINSLSLFPNPTTGEITITSEIEIKNGTFIVQDISGKTLSEFSFSGTVNKYNLSQFREGIYLLKLYSADMTTIFKLNLQKP